MSEHSNRPFCPDPQVLAAFVEGTLAPAQIPGVRDHLATCNDCLDDVSDAAAHLREHPITGRQSPAWFRPTAMAAAIAVVVSLAIFGAWYQQHDPADALRAVKMDERPIGPRFAGFGYAPAARTFRGGEPSSNDYNVQAKSYEIVEKFHGSSSPKAQHAVGVAEILLRPSSPDKRKNEQEALDKLGAAAAKAPDDPKILNDYAAALWFIGAERGDETLRARAMETIERVLRLRPDYAEALFNRAYFLHAQKSPAAAAAWQRYLAVDPSSPWADEVRAKYQGS